MGLIISLKTMLKKKEIFERLKISYIIDRENIMNHMNKMINNHDVFLIDESKLKEQIDKLGVIEQSIEQVSYFINQLSQDIENGNSFKGSTDNPASD